MNTNEQTTSIPFDTENALLITQDHATHAANILAFLSENYFPTDEPDSVVKDRILDDYPLLYELVNTAYDYVSSVARLFPEEEGRAA